MLDVALRDSALTLQPGLVALRRDLHANPELAFEEHRTSALIAGRLDALGMEVQTGLAGTGVLAILKGSKPGKTVLLRCDLDAVEQTEVPGREYGSKHEGRTHSCGHDVNMTMLLGAADLLAARRDEIAGTAALLFQPADEPMAGARRLLSEGLFERVHPDAIIGLHVAPDINAGEVGIQAGPVWSSSDTRTIRLTWPTPPAGVTVAAAQLVSALYSMIGSESTALFPTTFAVTSIDAKQVRGEPLEAAISTRLATFDNTLRERLLERIETISRSTAALFNAEVSIEAGPGIPALINDAGVASIVAAAVREQLGDAAVVQRRHDVPDDFALYLEKVPGAMVLFGTANPAKGITAMWHNPAYDCDEDVLHQGAQVMALAAMRLAAGS